MQRRTPCEIAHGKAVGRQTGLQPQAKHDDKRGLALLDFLSVPRALAAALLFAMAGSVLANELTPLEQRYLRGMAPVLAFARQQALALDVVVQPQAADGLPPVALAHVAERCKLVLSLRGNPEGEATLARIPPALLEAALQMMAAHELGHCRRYQAGAWFDLPAGFAPSARLPDDAPTALQTQYERMRAVRREEGFGDLVALAWARQRLPGQYAQLHAWLVQEREADLQPGSHHDTLVWLHLAGPRGEALAEGSVFDAAYTLWLQGLARDP